MFHVTYTYIFRNYLSSDVLVLSDIRPFRNVMFCDVLTPQVSSFCNSACLSFQAFALRDIKCQPKNRRLSHRPKDKLSL